MYNLATNHTYVPVIKRETIVCSDGNAFEPIPLRGWSQVVHFSERWLMLISIMRCYRTCNVINSFWQLFTNSETTFDCGHRIVWAKMHLTAKIFLKIPKMKIALFIIFIATSKCLYWNSLNNSVMHCESGLICRSFTILRMTKNQR